MKASECNLMLDERSQVPLPGFPLSDISRNFNQVESHGAIAEIGFNSAEAKWSEFEGNAFARKSIMARTLSRKQGLIQINPPVRFA